MPKCFIAMLMLLSGLPPLQALQAPTRTMVAKKALPAVVMIRGKEEAGAFGSGFIVSSDGKIVTALHVISGLSSIKVQLPNGDTYDNAMVIGFDQQKDLAILKIPGFDLPTVELGNSNHIAPGDPVTLLGNPKGLTGTVTAGIISAVRDSIDGSGFKVIQTDAATNPGNSGGPLLNAAGLAVGVISSRLTGAEGLNFAVPINYARGMILDPKEPITLKALQARLGLEAKDAPPLRPPADRTTRNVGNETVITSLTGEELKAILRSKNAQILEDTVKDGCRVSFHGFKCTVWMANEGKSVHWSLLLIDVLPLASVNKFNEAHEYGFVLQRASDQKTFLELDLFIAGGVTERTIYNYHSYFGTMVGDLNKVFNPPTK